MIHLDQKTRHNIISGLGHYKQAFKPRASYTFSVGVDKVRNTVIL